MRGAYFLVSQRHLVERTGTAAAVAPVSSAVASSNVVKLRLFFLMVIVKLKIFFFKLEYE